MNQKELVQAVAEETGKSQKETRLVLESILNNIKAALIQEEEVRLFQFGTFKTQSNKARTGRNPKTGEVMQIPERQSVRFKASEKLLS
jgi:DNA-binding protein HU-beta